MTLRTTDPVRFTLRRGRQPIPRPPFGTILATLAALPVLWVLVAGFLCLGD